MEEILSLIFHGCKLTRDLESKLPSLTNDPSLLASSCEDIITTFSRAAVQLKSLVSPAPPELEAGVQEWLTTSSTQAMAMAMLQTLDPYQSQLFSDKNPFDVRVVTSRDAEGGSSSARSRGGGELQAAEGSGVGKSPVIQRSRKRKDCLEKRTIRAAAPRIGNTEIPPEDGFTWRKYGQKEILGSRFPRSYYKCTHKSFYACIARKQVQRLDGDPNTLEVTYCGHHTCLMPSATSSVPPPPAAATIWPEPSLSTSFPLRRWDSMDQMETSTPTDLGLRMSGSFNVAGGASLNTTSATTEALVSSQSQAREGKEVEWPDLADTMFNSGSSGSDMDAFFGPM